MSLKINRTDFGDVTVLELVGRITLGEGAVVLRDTVKDLLLSKRLKVVLDYGKVSYQDSMGNGELVAAFTMARNVGGEIVLLNLTKKVHDLFQISKLYTVFAIYSQLSDALAHFGTSTSKGAQA